MAIHGVPLSGIGIPHQYTAFEQMRSRMPAVVQQGFKAVFTIATAIPSLRLANEVLPLLKSSEMQERVLQAYPVPELAEPYQAFVDSSTPLAQELNGAIQSLSSIQDTNSTTFQLPETGLTVRLYDFCQAALYHLGLWNRLNTVLSTTLSQIMTSRTKSFQHTVYTHNALNKSLFTTHSPATTSTDQKSSTNLSEMGLFIMLDCKQIQEDYNKLNTDFCTLVAKISACTEEMEIWGQIWSDVPLSDELKDRTRCKLDRYRILMNHETGLHEQAITQLMRRIDTALKSAQAINPQDQRTITVASTTYSVHAYSQRYLIPTLQDQITLCCAWRKRVHLLIHNDRPSFWASHTSLQNLLEQKPSTVTSLLSLFQASLNFAIPALQTRLPSVVSTNIPFAPSLAPPWNTWYDTSSTFALPVEIEHTLEWMEKAIRSLSLQATASDTWQSLTESWFQYKDLKGVTILERIMHLRMYPLPQAVDWPQQLTEYRRTLVALVLDDLKVKASTLQANSPGSSFSMQDTAIPILTSMYSLLRMPTPENTEFAEEVLKICTAAEEALASKNTDCSSLEHSLVMLNSLLLM
jgi:hypothetical protein